MIFSLLGFCFSWALQFLPNMSLSNHKFDLQIDDPQEETIPHSSICCVCLDLLYKPIVLECGHVSCFWCVHKSMDSYRESHCPICRNPYHHFPSICELLHFLLLKMYPIAYKRREKQILEEEKKMGFFSPELDRQEHKTVGGSNPDILSAACSIGEFKDGLTVDAEGSDSVEGKNSPAIDHDRSCSDLLCPACQQFLFRPAVLNCGHVFCEACIRVTEDGVIICKVCEIPHPNDYPKICLELNNILEEHFQEEYAVRKENVEQMQAQFQHESPPSCSGSKKSAKKACIDDNEGLRGWKERGSKVHFGAGCDYCGVVPIVGDRYKCQDCTEAIGFDLCGDCYNTRSKRAGRFNQQHTPDHRLELIKPVERRSNLVLRLVGGHLVDSSGTPVIALSALEESLEGWVAIDSGIAAQNNDNNAVTDTDSGNHDNDVLGDTLDGSIFVEFSDAPGTTTTSIGPVRLHDHNMEHQENHTIEHQEEHSREHQDHIVEHQEEDSPPTS